MITWIKKPKLLDERSRFFDYKESRTGSIGRTLKKQLIFDKSKKSSMKNLK